MRRDSGQCYGVVLCRTVGLGVGRDPGRDKEEEELSAYLIAELEILDEEAYAEYRALASPTFAEFGGELVVRNVEPESLEGEWEPGLRVVVIKFEDVARTRAWFESDSYRRALLVAPRAMSRRMSVVEGAS